MEEYTSIEYLSIAVMITIGTFALDFIYSDRKIYKIVALDEAWSLLQVAQGAALSNKLVRAGRSMQSGVFLSRRVLPIFWTKKSKTISV